MQKPSFDAWIHLASVVIDRLTTVVHVYHKPPFNDVFMPLASLQKKAADTASLLREFHAQIEGEDFPLGHQAEALEATAHEEEVIDALAPLLNDVLRRLPALSSDMQALLKSPWFDNCSGRLATELFRGPSGHEEEGIGSGMPENGRLPKFIQDFLEKEQVGDTRPARPPQADRAEKYAEATKRWGRNNASFLRTAGRVD